MFSAGVDVVNAVREAIIRQASSWGAGRIRVSSMSDVWLRTHETESEKHRSDSLGYL
jgi:hypothetical protein